MARSLISLTKIGLVAQTAVTLLCIVSLQLKNIPFAQVVTLSAFSGMPHVIYLIQFPHLQKVKEKEEGNRSSGKADRQGWIAAKT